MFVRPWIGADAMYPVKAAAFFAILFITVGGIAGAQHSHTGFGPANTVTTVRAVLAGLVAGLIGHTATHETLWAVIGVTVLMALLDGIDGALARSTRMASTYGARFDMETDAAFILVLSILVWQQGKAGPWVLACGLMRYLFVAAGWVFHWLAAPLRATRRGRVVAVVQVLGLGVALAPVIPPAMSAAVAAGTLAALAWSFAIDIAWLWRHDHRAGFPSLL
jgi:phosphatidylglycerophosphate synthase